MVILEAMASGLPIVATAVGGAITALSEGRGLLVAPGDVEGMATALKNCHDDRAGALERARLAQAYVQQELTYMQNGQSLVRLYRSLAER